MKDKPHKVMNGLKISIIAVLGMVAVMAGIAGIYMTGHFKQIIFILAALVLTGIIIAWNNGDLDAKK